MPVPIQSSFRIIFVEKPVEDRIALNVINIIKVYLCNASFIVGERSHGTKSSE